MEWVLKYSEGTYKDLENLDNSQQKFVIKAIRKVLENPLPKNEGGYGKPLENQSGIELAGLLKIKLLKTGIRVVYKIERKDRVMEIIVISIRDDKKVYCIATRFTGLHKQF